MLVPVTITVKLALFGGLFMLVLVPGSCPSPTPEISGPSVQ